MSASNIHSSNLEAAITNAYTHQIQARRITASLRGFSRTSQVAKVRTLSESPTITYKSIQFGDIREAASVSIIEHGGETVVALSVGTASLDDGSWRLNQQSARPVAHESEVIPRDKPFIYQTALGFGHYAIGLFASSEEVATMRLTLSSGVSHEASVIDGIGVLLVPLVSEEDWGDLATFEIRDSADGTITTEAHWVNPTSFPG